MAAELLWENQRKAIQELKRLGVLVKINTILIPGVNDHHITEVAGTVAKMGVDVLNIMPLYPTRNTVFGSVKEPSPTQIENARKQAAQFLPQMSHCSRCRADAAGLLGAQSTEEQFELLRSVARTGIGQAKASGCDTHKCSPGSCGNEKLTAAA